MLKIQIYKEDIETYRTNLKLADHVSMQGKIKYNPKRPNLKKKSECCIIEVSPELPNLYRYFLNKKFGISLEQPSWNGHITIISAKEVLYLERNKPHLLKQFWNKYNGHIVDFKYSLYPRYSGDTDEKTRDNLGLYWFLDVKSDSIQFIRKELGLNELKTAHITIAKRK